jgi:CRP-like cAMP-binding protein
MLIPHLVLMNVPLRKVPAGVSLLEEGTPGKSVYVLEEGEVRITVGGREITYISERGAVFGEMAALLDRPRGATVTAVSDSRFFVIDDFLAFLRRDADLSLFLLRVLAQRIDEMNAQVAERSRWWQIF